MTTTIERLRRGRAARRRLVRARLAQGIAHQVRTLREQLGWSQATLAARVGTNQNAIYRLESPRYGKATLTTLRKVAAAMDVALIVRFASYSELIDPVAQDVVSRGGVLPFHIEEREGAFARDRDGAAATKKETPTRLLLHSADAAKGVVEVVLWRQRQYERPPRPIV